VSCKMKEVIEWSRKLVPEGQRTLEVLMGNHLTTCSLDDRVVQFCSYFEYSRGTLILVVIIIIIIIVILI
jgi:hypothetical protein